MYQCIIDFQLNAKITPKANSKKKNKQTKNNKKKNRQVELLRASWGNISKLTYLRDKGSFTVLDPIYWGPGGALPFLAYTGMCRWTGYGFQGRESYTGYTISLLSVLNRVSFWTGSLSKSVKTCDERSTFAIPIIFFPKYTFPLFQCEKLPDSVYKTKQVRVKK